MRKLDTDLLSAFCKRLISRKEKRWTFQVIFQVIFLDIEILNFWCITEGGMRAGTLIYDATSIGLIIYILLSQVGIILVLGNVNFDSDFWRNPNVFQQKCDCFVSLWSKVNRINKKIDNLQQICQKSLLKSWFPVMRIYLAFPVVRVYVNLRDQKFHAIYPTYVFMSNVNFIF